MEHTFLLDDGVDIDEVDLDLKADFIVSCRRVSKYGHRGNRIFCILDGLCLNIPKGIIFSLLGPSGCGKTTLLKCIVGRLVVDEGQLEVFGSPPKPTSCIGYMPQTLSLSSVLSVKEVLWLYGQLSGKDKQSIINQTNNVLEILQITQYLNKPIYQLSGGEQRRVSFAVALLSEAPLLILDEPTVGVDPILRQNIWNYLSSLVKETGTTVIITTHYIEEARMSDVVGLFLHGRILAQASPDHLLQTHCCQTLEDVFLQLSATEHCENQRASHRVIKGKCWPWVGSLKKCFHETYRETFSFYRLFTLVRKCHMEYRRFPIAILFQIIFPALVISIVPFLSSTGIPSVTLAVINHDSGTIGKQFLDSLNPKIYTLIYYDDHELALNRARLGDAFGVLSIPEHFTQSLMSKFLGHDNIDLRTVNDGYINATVDDNVPSVSNPILLELSNSMTRFAQSYIGNVGLNPELGDPPIQFSNDISGRVDHPFQAFATPGLIAFLAFTYFSSIISLHFVMAQTQGQFDRLYSAGVSSAEIVISQLIYQVILGIPVVILSVIMTIYVNQLPYKGSIWLIVLMFSIFFLNGICIGVLIGGVSSNLYSVVIVLDFTYMVVLLLQGPGAPMEGMNPYLRDVCSFGPLAYPILALRGVINYAWTFSHPSVVFAIGISSAWSLVGIVVGWLAFWFKK